MPERESMEGAVEKEEGIFFLRKKNDGEEQVSVSKQEYEAAEDTRKRTIQALKEAGINAYDWDRESPNAGNVPTELRTDIPDGWETTILLDGGARAVYERFSTDGTIRPIPQKQNWKQHEQVADSGSGSSEITKGTYLVNTYESAPFHKPVDTRAITKIVVTPDADPVKIVEACQKFLSGSR